MQKITLKNCWITVSGNEVLKARIEVPEEEQQKVFQFLPFESAGHFDSETGVLTAFFGGIDRGTDPFILKLDGTEADYSTRNQKGKRFAMGAPLSQHFTIVITMRGDGCPVLYSLQFQTDPILNSAGETHVEPKRRTKSAPVVDPLELEEDE